MPGGDFQCVPDASGELGGYADACEFINACDPGLFCANPEVVPDCIRGSSGCCSQYCNVGADDPNAQCDGAAAGQECTPWFAEGQSPPGYENVGGCAIPG